MRYMQDKDNSTKYGEFKLLHKNKTSAGEEEEMCVHMATTRDNGLYTKLLVYPISQTASTLVTEILQTMIVRLREEGEANRGFTHVFYSFSR